MLPTSRFLYLINQHQLLLPSDKVLIAVSGGRDSVLLTYLFNAAGFNFGIAHGNFGLRGNESDTDEQFTRKLALKLNVPFYSTCFATADYARQNKISVQMAARELRYNWFEEIRTMHHYNYIATAHHAGDTTETVLLNLIRGTGIAGLHGILPKRAQVIRPMLFLSRDEIDEIIRSENIPYREDGSNASSKYARNKLRLEVIPKLKELNPKLDETFEANSKRFAQLEDFLTNHVENLRKNHFVKISNEQYAINLAGLKQLNPLKLLLFEVFKPYGFSESVLNDLIQSWNGQPGKRFESATYLLLLDREKLILQKKADQQAQELIIHGNENMVHFISTQLRFTITERAIININTDSNNAFFDANMLQFPLKLRLWQTGDYFYPFGMSGKKKLSDYFTSLKIPLTDKKNIPVLENANGDIVWIVGYRTDNRYKVTEHTKKVITFEKLNTHDH